MPKPVWAGTLHSITKAVNSKECIHGKKTQNDEQPLVVVPSGHCPEFNTCDASALGGTLHS